MTITVYGIKDKFHHASHLTRHIFARKIFIKSTLLLSTRRSRLLNLKKICCWLEGVSYHLQYCMVWEMW